MRTVLVPRHPERTASVVDVLAAEFRTVLWSKQGEEMAPLAEDDIVIVDTIGQLDDFYGACDVAFVGGSLIPRGGQNMLEPAALGRAVAFGPHVFNFQRDVDQLLADRAAWQISDKESLVDDLCTLLLDEDLRRQLGARAVELIRRNRGSSQRTLDAVRPVLLQAAEGRSRGNG